MSLISVDVETCVNDGLCRDACPGNLIEIDDEEFPMPVSDIETKCVRCGHCIAICPTNALSHADLPQNEFVEIKKELEISQQAIEQFIKSRRSIRNYINKPIPRIDIEKVLDITRYAPTGHNDQDVRWSIFDKREDLRNIADSVIDFFRLLVKTNQHKELPFDLNNLIDKYEKGDDRILRNAPVLIIAHGTNISPMTGISCYIALATFELAARGYGLGTCWVGFVMMAAMSGYEPLLNLLNLPEDQQLYGAMIMGYPKFKYNQIPFRNKPIVYWHD